MTMVACNPVQSTAPGSARRHQFTLGRSILSSLSLLAIAATLASASGDDWKTKPYQKWDEKDIQQVLFESPWVKAQAVAVTWRSDNNRAKAEKTESAGVRGDKLASLGPPSGACDPVTRGGACDEGPDAVTAGRARPADENAPNGPSGQNTRNMGTALFFVRWNSAQTIREALARNAVLNHKASESEALKFVAETPPDYAIFLAGRDMSPFAGVSEEELNSKVSLEAKQSKQEIHPLRVTLNRTPDHSRITFIMFSFPRQTAENQPFITPKDTDVEFVCHLKNFNLRVDFGLPEMRTEKGPDF